jgi:hypothetical protein
MMESVRNEDKLGQPLILLGREGAYGSADLYILPYFRPKEFYRKPAHLLVSELPVSEEPLFLSSDRENHVDYAMRWVKSFDALDVGISYFIGTDRDSNFVYEFEVGALSPRSIVPVYEQVRQVGVEFQYIVGGLALKLESIRKEYSSARRNFYTMDFDAIYVGALSSDYTATVAGFEYTLFSIGPNSSDLGILFEYLHNDRNNSLLSPFDRDVFAGFRLNLGDTRDTYVLIGSVFDAHDEGNFSFVEGSSRLLESFRIDMNIYFYDSSKPDDGLYLFRKDDFAELKVSWYF